MTKAFEGLLGNNCELRIIEFLLGLDDIEFNVSELAGETGVSRPTVTRVIKKFVEWDVMKIAKVHAGHNYYQLNHESPFVVLFESLNNLLIERILGEEILFQINDLWKEHFLQITQFMNKESRLESQIKSVLDEKITWPRSIAEVEEKLFPIIQQSFENSPEENFSYVRGGLNAA